MKKSKIDTNSVAYRIVRIPRMLLSEGESAFGLASRSGYFELHDQVGEREIRKQLRLSPQLGDEWIDYSEDKRVRAGWFIRPRPDGRYEVGYYGGPKGPSVSVLLQERIDALARFIKEEMDSLRELRNR